MANVRRLSRVRGVQLCRRRMVQRIGVAHPADSHGDFTIARDIRWGLFLSIALGAGRLTV